MRVELILDWDALHKSIQAVKDFPVESLTLLDCNDISNPATVCVGHRVWFRVEANNGRYLVHCSGRVEGIAHTVNCIRDEIHNRNLLHDSDRLFLELEDVYPCEYMNPFVRMANDETRSGG